MVPSCNKEDVSVKLEKKPGVVTLVMGQTMKTALPKGGECIPLCLGLNASIQVPSCKKAFFLLQCCNNQKSLYG